MIGVVMPSRLISFVHSCPFITYTHAHLSWLHNRATHVHFEIHQNE